MRLGKGSIHRFRCTDHMNSRSWLRERFVCVGERRQCYHVHTGTGQGGGERLRCCERRLEADVHPDAGDEDRRDRAILA